MRRLSDFVKDLLEKGRTVDQIRTIALCTQWKNSMQELEEELNRQVSEYQETDAKKRGVRVDSQRMKHRSRK